MDQTNTATSSSASRQLGSLNTMMDQGRSFSSHERNCCFLNTSPGERFATISATSGLDFPDDSRAAVSVDWDQDGYPDLWFSNRNAPRLRFMHNDHPHTNHFLALKLQGNGVSTNRDAIGARVELLVKGLGNRRLVKSRRAGEGFLSQSTPWLHFGLGALTEIERIIVHWPGGGREEFTGATADQRYLLVQGSGKARNMPVVPRQLALQASEQKPLPPPACTRVPLVTQMPLPRELGYIDFQGTPQRLPIGQGKPVLLLMWASWCAPCQKELLELATHASQLKSTGVEVYALAVDGLSEDGSDPNDAPRFLSQKQIPFTAGRSTAQLAQLLTGYHHQLVVLNRPLPIPVSFLIDGLGRLTTIYKGRLQMADLLVDLQRTPANLRQRWEQSACLPGAMLPEESLFAALSRIEAATCYEMGMTFYQGKNHPLALEYFRMAVQAEPGFGEAHQSLAMMQDSLGQNDQALQSYQQALKFFPERAILHYNLGVMYQRQGRRDQAMLRYREALRLEPTMTAAKRALEGLERK